MPTERAKATLKVLAELYPTRAATWATLTFSRRSRSLAKRAVVSQASSGQTIGVQSYESGSIASKRV